MQVVRTDNIIVKDRQRTVIKPAELERLRESITRNGLIHPILVTSIDGVLYLVAGERRLRAVEVFTEPYVHGDELIEPGYVPVTLQDDLDDIDRQEIELDENILREDLSWQDRARAIAALHKLRQAQFDAAETGEKQTITDTASEIAATTGANPSTLANEVSRSLLIADQLSNPKIASAKNLKDAVNIASRDFEAVIYQDLHTQMGSKSDHEILHGDCIPILQEMQPEILFDCILTDPPYGMGADNFGDVGQVHHYKDDRETALSIASCIFEQGFRLTKPLAHLYMFCDISLFEDLCLNASLAGWQVFRTPLIWHKTSSMGHDPWPQRGFRRSYETILYAAKGGKPYNRFLNDVIPVPNISDPHHPAAKPVELYRLLLDRSCMPGDKVLDPCCGTGPIFEASNILRLSATGIEFDEIYFQLASVRRYEGVKL
jgi:site-specific DNA-methyltransferase (adenine-specific)